MPTSILRKCDKPLPLPSPLPPPLPAHESLDQDCCRVCQGACVDPAEADAEGVVAAAAAACEMEDAAAGVAASPLAPRVQPLTLRSLAADALPGEAVEGVPLGEGCGCKILLFPFLRVGTQVHFCTTASAGNVALCTRSLDVVDTSERESASSGRQPPPRRGRGCGGWWRRSSTMTKAGPPGCSSRGPPAVRSARTTPTAAPSARCRMGRMAWHSSCVARSHALGAEAPPGRTGQVATRRSTAWGGTGMS
mmetsp:Transcript_14826/g.43957  ORF Transcript_14826/g.43957 Transcript_14826/m.43957 type:complete len:250 (-) Transcript_14826:186-935(-)